MNDIFRNLPRCHFCGGPNLWGGTRPCQDCHAARLHTLGAAAAGRCDCKRPRKAPDGETCICCLGRLRPAALKNLRSTRGHRPASKPVKVASTPIGDPDLAARRRAAALKAVATRKARLAGAAA